MKVLLDTHAFLWYLLGDSNLSLKSKHIIDTKENLYFSIVSMQGDVQDLRSPDK